MVRLPRPSLNSTTQGATEGLTSIPRISCVGADHTHDAFSRVRKEREAAGDLKSYGLERHHHRGDNDANFSRGEWTLVTTKQVTARPKIFD